MRTIHTEIGVLAPATSVWSVLVAIDKWPEWNPFARAAGRLAIGERLDVEIRPPGKSAMTFRPTVVRLEPGRELRWLGRLGMPGLFDGEHGFRVVPEDAGRCRFEQFETFRGLLVAPIMWMAEAPTRAGFESMNRAIKARAEAA
ncbi:MAG: SRPBCC domain-containing protein [Hyphomicrobiaceae bacterium]|nr:MAG: SRPBCC domain-containing protein [Hyphomicrobiaceae bacterium]